MRGEIYIHFISRMLVISGYSISCDVFIGLMNKQPDEPRAVEINIFNGRKNIFCVYIIGRNDHNTNTIYALEERNLPTGSPLQRVTL